MTKAEKTPLIRKLWGTPQFYKQLVVLMVPIMIQNGITNFVNMLDNIMIGATGTDQMTGVSLANQFFFVFNLCIFGAVSGAGIFGAQFFGNNDHEGVRHTFRFKMIFSILLTIAGIALFIFFGEDLLKLYMKGESASVDPVATLGYGKDYIKIMLIGVLPYTIVQCYSGTLREGAAPTLPMIAGVIAVGVNLVFNYILIFGKFGAPAMGVEGAAVATVLSRFVELAIVVICTHANKKRFPYMQGVYKSLYVPGSLVGQLLVKSLPLMLNETLWSAGIAMVNESYSYRTLDAIAAGNISQTFWNVFSIAYLAVGNAIGIILGQMLGANRLKEAKEASYKMISFSFVIAFTIGMVYMVAAEFIPLFYKADDHIRSLATTMMQITALAMPFEALAHASYFTLRSGGKIGITLVFDSGFMWGVNVLLAFLLTRYTDVSLLGVFTIIQFVAVIKSVCGLLLVKSGYWVKNIVEDGKSAAAE